MYRVTSTYTDGTVIPMDCADDHLVRSFLHSMNTGHAPNIGGHNARQSSHYQIANFPDRSSGNTFTFPTCTVQVERVA